MKTDPTDPRRGSKMLVNREKLAKQVAAAFQEGAKDALERLFRKLEKRNEWGEARVEVMARIEQHKAMIREYGY